MTAAYPRALRSQSGELAHLSDNNPTPATPQIDMPTPSMAPSANSHRGEGSFNTALPEKRTADEAAVELGDKAEAALEQSDKEEIPPPFGRGHPPHGRDGAAGEKAGGGK